MAERQNRAREDVAEAVEAALVLLVKERLLERAPPCDLPPRTPPSFAKVGGPALQMHCHPWTPPDLASLIRSAIGLSGNCRTDQVVSCHDRDTGTFRRKGFALGSVALYAL